MKRIIKNYLNYSNNHPSVNEFIKYCLIGVTNAVLDYSVYLGLTRFFDYWRDNFLAANLIAVFLANLSSFFLNKYFTFQNRSKRIFRQYMKFITVSLIYLGIVQAVMFIGVDYFGLYDIWAKVIASGVGLVWNFFANKHWSFRPGYDI